MTEIPIERGREEFGIDTSNRRQPLFRFQSIQEKQILILENTKIKCWLQIFFNYLIALNTFASLYCSKTFTYSQYI